MITTTLVLAAMTWYGGPFVGQHHAAYWHNQTPLCAPAIVDYHYPGVAACSDYEFGEVLRFEGNGRVAYGVMMDRRARDLCGYFDAWPKLAGMLGFGPRFGKLDVGVIDVEVTRLPKRKDER